MVDPALELTELRVLTPAEASKLLTISLPVMERMRRAGTGPRFIRLSARRLGYRVDDVRAWMEARAEGSKVAA